ncbi:MAG: hypothetical protein AB2L26_07345 [Ignavibacteria bacterium]
MILNTSLAYGSKLLLEFSYVSRLQDAGRKSYNWGLTSTQIDNYAGRRDVNYYGQLKWNYVASLNHRLREIGEIMYPAGKPNEHLVHEKTITVNTLTYPCDECGISSYDYVSDIRSLAPLISGENPCSATGVSSDYYDCAEQRYWELGFFKTNPSSPNQYDKSKYLFALNKRTYPVNGTNNYGDVRILKIKFNPEMLNVSTDWVIKDARTDSALAYFDGNTSNYIYAGSINPAKENC